MYSITSSDLKSQILDSLDSQNLNTGSFQKMIDYTIDIFEANGLGSDYYGYHNIDHELEVTLGTLIVGKNPSILQLTQTDIQYLFAAALFHDFDPEKSIDKPHEENVLHFLETDSTIKHLFDEAGLDINIIKVLILRTTFPWSGSLKENAEKEIADCFSKSSLTQNNTATQEYYMNLGWILSIIDRVIGYALGDFSKAMHLAKTNSHALAWHPALIVRRSVNYFESLLGNEGQICEMVLRSLPKEMRKNFMDNVLSFMNLRQQEIKIQSDFVYENIKLIPKIESMKIRDNDDFVKSLYSIYLELPKPLRFQDDNFAESLLKPTTLLNTIRLGNVDGPVVGFAKGGPLESYDLQPEIHDHNRGKNNTVFLEPISIRMGYWGLRGGHEMRHLFLMQSQSMNYEFLTSFALRDVVEKRSKSKERAEFVARFDPERWDYYRIKI